MGIKDRFEQGWDGVPPLCKLSPFLDVCVVRGWQHGRVFLILSDFWLIVGLIRLSYWWYQRMQARYKSLDLFGLEVLEVLRVQNLPDKVILRYSCARRLGHSVLV